MCLRARGQEPGLRLLEGATEEAQRPGVRCALLLPQFPQTFFPPGVLGTQLPSAVSPRARASPAWLCCPTPPAGPSRELGAGGARAGPLAANVPGAVGFRAEPSPHQDAGCTGLTPRGPRPRHRHFPSSLGRAGPRATDEQSILVRITWPHAARADPGRGFWWVIGGQSCAQRTGPRESGEREEGTPLTFTPLQPCSPHLGLAVPGSPLGSVCRVAGTAS